MQTIARNTDAHNFPTYEPMAEAQACTDFAADRQRHTPPAPVQHYATYHEVEGVATRRAGGWTFQGAGSVDTWLVSYQDIALVLLGNKTLADAQREADTMAGGLAAICCGR